MSNKSTRPYSGEVPSPTQLITEIETKRTFFLGIEITPQALHNYRQGLDVLPDQPPQAPETLPASDCQHSIMNTWQSLVQYTHSI